MAVTFTTHGHRMTAELAEALRGSVHFVRLSMDGLGATYERLRGRSFDAFRRKVDFVSRVAPFGLNVVINDETVTELDAIASFAKESGAVEILLLPEQPVGKRHGISASASVRLTEWISSTSAGVRLAISESGATDEMPLARPFQNEQPLEAHAHIDARGLVRPHAYAVEGVPVGASILESLDQLRARRAT
jgi:MoaA/NifB/PqqE/SkfB family radical SAM enzyme